MCNLSKQQQIIDTDKDLGLVMVNLSGLVFHGSSLLYSAKLNVNHFAHPLRCSLWCSLRMYMTCVSVDFLLYLANHYRRSIGSVRRAWSDGRTDATKRIISPASRLIITHRSWILNNQMCLPKAEPKQTDISETAYTLPYSVAWRISTK